jgi:hypothetical protein
MVNLVTLQDYKTYKKLSKTDSDAELNLIINSVSVMVKSYIGHSLLDYYSTPKVEYFNTNASQVALLLTEWPIVNVSLVETRITYQDDYTTVDPVEYYVDSSMDSVYNNKGYWNQGYGAVRVTYTAGYASTPEDIKLATLDLVHHYFKEEYKERKSIGNATIDNSTSRANALATEWPMHVTRVLDFYKNV